MKTVSDTITSHINNLTRSEKQLAGFLLENYPFSGLGSIAVVSEQSGVSGPTIVRLVKKLGYAGYAEFQSHLHKELEHSYLNPIKKHERWHGKAPGTHVLNRFADAIMSNLRDSLAEISINDFDSAVAELSNRKKEIFLAGGRMTHSLANYFFNHLQIIRPGVTLVSPNLSGWRHYLLNLKAGDVLVLFDVRRYDPEAKLLAKRASELGAHVILFTDNWGSPASQFAKTTFKLKIDVHASWDSSVVTVYLLEALIEAVQSVDWGRTRERLSTLEDTLDPGRIFQKSLSDNPRRKR